MKQSGYTQTKENSLLAKTTGDLDLPCLLILSHYMYKIFSLSRVRLATKKRIPGHQMESWFQFPLDQLKIQSPQWENLKPMLELKLFLYD